MDTLLSFLVICHRDKKVEQVVCNTSATMSVQGIFHNLKKLDFAKKQITIIITALHHLTMLGQSSVKRYVADVGKSWPVLIVCGGFLPIFLTLLWLLMVRHLVAIGYRNFLQRSHNICYSILLHESGHVNHVGKRKARNYQSKLIHPQSQKWGWLNELIKIHNRSVFFDRNGCVGGLNPLVPRSLFVYYQTKGLVIVMGWEPKKFTFYIRFPESGWLMLGLLSRVADAGFVGALADAGCLWYRNCW
ncbi:choline transporter protein 1 [Tanacetum coccineum]